MTYCDECGTDSEEDCPYHDLSDCEECKGVSTVQLVHVSANPEDGDEYFCDRCGHSEPY